MRGAFFGRWVAVAGHLALVSALAGQPFPLSDSRGQWWVQEWKGETSAAPRVIVTSRGAVEVRGAEIDDVRYHLTTRVRGGTAHGVFPQVFDSPGVDVGAADGETMRLALRDPKCSRCRVEYRLEVEVPAGTEAVSVETVAGPVRVVGIAGSVSARANGGAIQVDRVGGAVAAVTAGGNVLVGSVGGHVHCETVGGAIELARSGGAAKLVTGAGPIRASRVGGDLHAETGGGSIEIGRVDGVVRARTGGGLIRVADARNGTQAEADAGDIRIDRALGRLMLASGAGDIVARIQEGAMLEDSELTTSTGAILLTLPDSLPLTLDASIALARGLRGIFSDFPALQVRRLPGPRGPRAEQAVGTINGGGSTMRIRNGRGSIEIRRLAGTRRVLVGGENK